jgi:proline iminopeptidase
VPLADLNDTTIFYDAVGSGPPCLVLHGGLGVDHTLYRNTLGRLAGSYELILYDHRGNGRSGRPPVDTITIEQLADDADALAGHLGLGPVTVFGQSYGGFVGQELAIRHPDRVARLILVGTTPGQLGSDETPEDEQGAPPPARLVELLSSEPATDEECAEMWKGAFPLLLRDPGSGVLDGALDDTICDAVALRRSRELLAGWSSIDRLGGVTAPTLLLVGRHDVACSPPQSHRIARHLPDATVVVLEESGHFPWIEEPDVFYEALERWCC